MKYLNKTLNKDYKQNKYCLTKLRFYLKYHTEVRKFEYHKRRSNKDAVNS